MKTIQQLWDEAMLGGRVYRVDMVGSGASTFKNINRLDNAAINGKLVIAYYDVFKVLDGMVASNFGLATIIQGSDSVGDVKTPIGMSFRLGQSSSARYDAATVTAKAKISATGYSSGNAVANIPFPLGKMHTFGPWLLQPGISIAAQVTWSANEDGYSCWRFVEVAK